MRTDSSTVQSSRLTVRLLEPGTGTLTTKLLGFAPSVVSDQECAVVCDEGLLELVLGVLIDELLVVCDLRVDSVLVFDLITCRLAFALSCPHLPISFSQGLSLDSRLCDDTYN